MAQSPFVASTLHCELMFEHDSTPYGSAKASSGRPASWHSLWQASKYLTKRSVTCRRAGTPTVPTADGGDSYSGLSGDMVRARVAR